MIIVLTKITVELQRRIQVIVQALLITIRNALITKCLRYLDIVTRFVIVTLTSV